jgi:hypothetical protein
MTTLILIIICCIVLLVAGSLAQTYLETTCRRRWLENLEPGAWVTYRGQHAARFEGWADDGQVRMTSFEGLPFVDYSFTITPL